MFFRKNYQTVLMNEIRDFNKLNILDVRESDEYSNGHIHSAISLPLSSIENNITSLDKEKEYHVVCHSGGRSQQASAYLSQKGFKVTNVMGGMAMYKGSVVQ